MSSKSSLYCASPDFDSSLPGSPLLQECDQTAAKAKSERRKWYQSPKFQRRKSRSPHGLWSGSGSSALDPPDESSGSDKSSLAASDGPPGYYVNSFFERESQEDKDAPMRDSLGAKDTERYTSLTSRDTLRQALDSPIGLAKFGQFLANELSAEQLCFWLNSQQLSSDLRSLHSLCHRIHDLHVPAEAPLALNLSSSEQQNLQEAAAVLQATPDPFAKCADLVFEAMHADSWTRFVKLRLSLAQKAYVRERRKLRDSFCMCDIREGPEQLLCMISKGFEKLSGYPLDEALSMNCRALQGPDSSPLAIGRVRRALEAGTSIQELMVNYTKGGTPFWVLLQMECLRDETGAVRYILGHQLNLSAHTSDLSWLLDDSLDVAEAPESPYVHTQKEAVFSTRSLSGSGSTHGSQQGFASHDPKKRLRDATALAFDATAQRFNAAGAKPAAAAIPVGLPIPTSACAPLGILGVPTRKVDRQLVTGLTQIITPPDSLQWQNCSPAKFILVDPKSLTIRFSSPSLPIDWAQGRSFATLLEELNHRRIVSDIKRQINQQEYFTLSPRLRVFPAGETYTSRGRLCPLAVTPLLGRQHNVDAVVVMFAW